MRGWSLLENLVKDARHGLRQLRGSPGFALVAILTLALGIGANRAIFTMVHAVMLRSLPVVNPGQLYSLGDNVICCDTASYQESFTLYSYALYKHLREHTPEFSDITAFQSWLANLSVRRLGSPEPARPYLAEFVSGNYFPMLGVGAFAGRSLSPDDDRPNAQPIAIISYRAWSQSYGFDRSIIGSTLTFNGQPFTVVGVAPPGFFGETLRSDPPDFWIPLATEPLVSRDNPLLNTADVYWLYAIGRVNPGVQPSQVQAKVTTEIKQWLNDQAGVSVQDKQRIAKLHMTLTPAGGGIAGIQSDYGNGLRLLLVVSILVLLIACANIANLLLARGAANRGETAVRIALGATRARLTRQMLTEGVLLAPLGGIVGVAMAFAGTRVILLLAFRGAAYVPINPNPSLPVLAFAVFLSLLTGVLSSIAPTWILLRGRVIDEHDTQGSRHVAVVNEAFERKFFPTEDSLGKHFGVGDVGHSGDFEIVGVVENTKYRDEKTPADEMFFLPMLQTETYTDARLASYQTWALFIDSVQLRVAGRPENLYSLVQRTLAEIDPNLTVLQLRTLDEQVAVRFNRPRLITRLTTLFGLLALGLACVGLYGVAAYMVAHRTSEIGVRMALGADRGNVILMMLRSAMAPVGLGLMIGILAAFAGGNLVASQLYGVKSHDPLVLLAAVLLLLLSTILAAIVPARRAASIDPIQALRTDWI